MGYQVLLTFDLKNASAKDYENAYAALRNMGLVKVQKGVTGDGKNIDAVIPTTTALGDGFEGANAGAVAQAIRAKAIAAFKALKLTSEIFVVAGRDGSWASGTT